MRKFIQLLFLIFILSVIPAFVFAQTANQQDGFLSDFVSRCWTAADGLPGNTVTALLQDDEGYIYIGTYESLVRFDGVEFVTLNKNTDPKYNFISARSLLQDSKGNIWVGSNDEGITCIRKDQTTLTYLTKDGLPNNSIRALCEDKAGNIWIGTSSGLAYINSENRVIRPEGLKDENFLVTQIYCDTAGRVWIVTGNENDVYIYTNKKFEVYNGITKIKNPKIDYVTQDTSGAFWFGVEPHYVVKINGSEEVVYDLNYNAQRRNNITKIYQDSKSNIWISAEPGVAIIHGGTISYFDNFNGLTDEKVIDILEDREGNMWFSTDRGGIQKLSLSKFKTTSMPTTINAICDDTLRGVTWLGGDLGLYCYKNGEFLENSLTEMCKGVRVRHISLSRNGNLLISTYGKIGQLSIDADGNIREWNTNNGLSGNKVRVAMELEDGTIFSGTTTGLNIIEKSGKISQITKNDGLPNEFIMCIYKADDGKIWCGTDGGGIFTLQKQGDTYSVDEFLTTENGLSGNVVFKICEINGDLWVCTGTGVSRVKKAAEGYEIFKFNSANGLGTDGVFQIIPDYTGTVWMTSNRGIFSGKLEDMEACANGKLRHISTRYFGNSDGLISGGVTSTSLSTKDSLGRIWFTMIDGFAVYDPVKIAENKKPPIVVVQEYTIDNERYPLTENKIVLNPGVKRFGLKFTGISFVSSELIQFSNKLEGFDKDYSEWTNTRTVSYTNLKHGTYKFYVMAENGDSNRSEPGEPITIIKKPYLWELAWFWILVGAVVIGTAILIIVLRIRRLRKQNIILEKKVEERTKELRLEKDRSESLLLNILPEDIAKELTEKPDETISKKYPNVTVMFTDIVGFTKMSDGLSAETVVKMLNNLFTRFDIRAKNEGIEKIKTIGDAYMAAAGLTENEDNDGAAKMIKYAKGVLEDLREFNEASEIKVSIRVGINTGNLVAGVIGKTKFIYDIWGDTVNTASRMESSGTPLKIHVSENTFKAAETEFSYSEPVEVEVKGKGLMKTYYVN